MKIVEDISNHEGSFYLEKDGVKLAQMDFTLNEEDMIISETMARAIPELEFEEEGMLLVMYAVNYARENKFRVIPVCPFANSIFLKNPEIRDILK